MARFQHDTRQQRPHFFRRTSRRETTLAGGTLVRSLDIHGSVSPAFERVREAFIENFSHRGELGGACCIYQHGEKVVDLWGGVRDRIGGEPWQEDMMTIVHSTTKGLAAMVMALAHSRGWLDYDERVLGFMKPSDTFRFGHSGAYGAPGAGGSMGYADPETGIGYGYVTNRMGTHLSGDPRDIALRAAIPHRPN